MPSWILYILVCFCFYSYILRARVLVTQKNDVPFRHESYLTTGWFVGDNGCAVIDNMVFGDITYTYIQGVLRKCTQYDLTLNKTTIWIFFHVEFSKSFSKKKFFKNMCNIKLWSDYLSFYYLTISLRDITASIKRKESQEFPQKCI